ncbi:branched-chain amino acid ABC transporter permease [Methylobacterium sp. Leaf93]|uniref:branched-chain amino acid ABC transporter permease n=1 Tax=Methylobacterium sp. Leaf93 TaxID=1736249 RepID=UPI0006FAA0B9|nr:branched-chain amino acid ABC transporter permease [Methylobacterium sp. Leaf93]KQP09479.1 branched-chain amino acid ABC transporter permease [Methylobacterium sp. Leaf93]
MPSTAVLLSQAFNGLALGSLLALVSSGLTIILGTLGVLNFAHGALFAVGAYTAFVMMQATHSFVLAMLGGCAIMLIIGFTMERLVIRHFYARPDEDQILVTYGIGIVLVEGLRAGFGGNSQRVPVPSWGTGATKLGFMIYPTYRLQLIGIVAALLVGLYLVLYRTSVGLVVRAGIENAGMVGILGIDVRRTFLLVFAVGIVAVGLAGMLYAPVVAVTPDMGASFMVQSFVVIVLGGLGSFPGAIVGGLIAGEIISLTSAFDSAYSEVMLYGLMALVLVARPQGLFGTEGRV